MGYVTSHTLTVDVPNGYEVDDYEIIAQLRKTHTEAMYALNMNGDSDNSCRWYASKEDLTAFSKLHPADVFTLHGEGENAGDLWNAYVKDGEMTLAKAMISYAPNPYRAGLFGKREES